MDSKHDGPRLRFIRRILRNRAFKKHFRVTSWREHYEVYLRTLLWIKETYEKQRISPGEQGWTISITQIKAVFILDPGLIAVDIDTIEKAIQALRADGLIQRTDRVDPQTRQRTIDPLFSRYNLTPAGSDFLDSWWVRDLVRDLPSHPEVL
jgi:hypothetical protein